MKQWLAPGGLIVGLIHFSIIFSHDSFGIVYGSKTEFGIKAMRIPGGQLPAAESLQTGVGHYGVFSGRRWAREVYPRVREMIQVMN